MLEAIKELVGIMAIVYMENKFIIMAKPLEPWYQNVI